MNIDQLIDEIEVYIDNCKTTGVLSGGSMIKVNRESWRRAARSYRHENLSLPMRELKQKGSCRMLPRKPES